MANPRRFLLPPGIGRALDKIKKEDERGLLYYMDYKANYYLLEKYVDKIVNPGCSTFLTKALNGDMLFARNYDMCHWRYNRRGAPEDGTGLIIVVRCTNKKAKYKSLGVVDGFWLDVAKGRYFEGTLSDGKTDVTLMAAAPLAIMDGINDQGLAVSIMHLPTENEWNETAYVDFNSLSEDEKKIAKIYTEHGEKPQRLDASVRKGAIAVNTADHRSWVVNKNFAVKQDDPGKKTLIHPVLMRKMLDFAKDVDEAVEIARSVNVQSPLRDNDYHILVSDKSGKSVILEWVNNKLNVADAKQSTNFHLTREDRYGYGYERYDILTACLGKYKNGMSEEIAMRTLQLASQNNLEGSDVGLTQWSSLYNLDKGIMKLTVFADYSKTYEYKI